ncbi:MAG: phytanoyl-CoA dioxygenase family protein [Betaproteobacteria bacterium]
MLRSFTSPAFRYLALADTGRNAWWRYLLGIVVIAASWIIGGAYAYGLVLLYLPLGAVTEFVAINASILMLLVAVVAVVVVLHRRPWRTLVTPHAQIDWRRMVQGAAVWVVLALVFSLIEHLLHPGRYAWSLDLARWLPFVLAALLLTPLQCAAEELVFRGYVLQGLGRFLRNPVMLALLSSVIFTLPHLYNPEVAAYGLAIMAANYFVMGLFLAGVTLRDGRLELAIGAHAGNNLLLALVVRYDDSVFETESVFTAGALDPVYSLVTLLLSAAFFYWWFFRRSSAAMSDSVMSDSSRLNPSFTPEQVAQFSRDGYQIVRGLVPAEACARLRAIAKRDLAAAVPPVEYEADTQYPGAPQSLEAPGGRTVRRLLQACARDAGFREWATAAPIVTRLKQLLGPQIALSQAHHNCVMTKDPAYSSLTSWHRDIRYWSFERPELVSVWLALGEERRDNGCLLLLPGSHGMDFDASRLDEAQFLRTDVAENAALLQTQVCAELNPGDVLFFHCRLFHAAGSNRAVQTKFSAVFTYHTTDNPPLPGTRSAAVPEIPLP